MIGEFLYQLSPRDGQQLAILPVTANGAASGGTGPEFVVYTVPPEFVLIPAAWYIVGLPVVGVTRCLFRTIYARPIGATSGERSIFIDVTDVANDSATKTSYRSATSIAGDLIIPPNYEIRINAGFDVANAGNNSSGNFYGYLLPRGNFSIP